METADPTPHPELNDVLGKFVVAVASVLADRFVGAYLHGSFAVGDFDPHSDVDFVVAVAGDVPDPVLPALQAMHGRIHDLPSAWARRLDGSYVPTQILRRADPAGSLLLYLDNGSRALVRSNHCNTRVTRWLVREHGVVLAGPDPRTLIDPIHPDDLRREASVMMRIWAEEIRADPEALNNRWYQPYAVLGYCRMLYTFHAGEIVSKPAAARWARDVLDLRWADLIQRAVAQRADPRGRARQQADPEDFRHTLEFIDYALRRTQRDSVSPRPGPSGPRRPAARSR